MTEFKQIVGRGTRVHEDTQQVLLHADRLPEGDEPLRRSRTSTASRCRSTSPGRTTRSCRPTRRADDGRADPPTPEDETSWSTRTSTGSGHDDDTPQPQDLRRRRAGGDRRRTRRVPGRRRASSSPRASATSRRRTVAEAVRAASTSSSSRWNGADRKQAIVDELDDEGLLLEALAEDVGKDLDPFDLICHVAFDQPPLTRRERAENVRKRDVFTKYGPQARAVLDALLQKYQDEGVIEPGRSRASCRSRRSTRWARRSS